MATLLPIMSSLSASVLYLKMCSSSETKKHNRLYCIDKRLHTAWIYAGTTSLLSTSYVLSGAAKQPFPFKIYPVKTYGVASLLSIGLTWLIFN